MARDKHQIPLRHRPPAPDQMVGHPRRLAILIGPKETDIEVVARKLKIVGVAPEEGDLLLRRKDQPHVGVFLGAIEVVQTALIERDNVAAQSGRGERLLLNLRHHLPPGLERIVGHHAGLHRRLHACRDILDRDQNIELQIAAAQFVGARGGGESIAKIVVLGIAERVQAVGPNVVVGEHQTVGRDK